MRRLVPLLALTLIASILVQSMQQIMVHAIGGSGHVEFLGQGGSYTVDPGTHFLVKRPNPFRFDVEPGPSYTAAAAERVYSSTGAPPEAYWGVWVDYGQVPEGCKIKYMTIDDDPDHRVNKFWVDDQLVYDLPQGMVNIGEFTTNVSGNLKLQVPDSIGVWLKVCADPPPTETPAPTDTPQPTATATSIPPTTTVTPTGTYIPPTATDAPPQPTATATEQPEKVKTPTPTATATKKPRLLSCMRINFEVSGQAAKAGDYEVRELGGRLLYVWHAQEGWTDSGWVQNIDITFEDVYVQVWYLDPVSGEPVSLDIYNPAPDTPYGWMSRGMCHALEVGWPGQYTPAPHQPDNPDKEAPVNPDGQSPAPEEKETIEQVTPPPPAPDPGPTPTRGTSLRG